MVSGTVRGSSFDTVVAEVRRLEPGSLVERLEFRLGSGAASEVVDFACASMALGEEAKVYCQGPQFEDRLGVPWCSEGFERDLAGQ